MRNSEAPNSYYGEEEAINAVNANYETRKRAREAEALAREKQQIEKERRSRAEKEAELRKNRKFKDAIKTALATAAIGGVLIGVLGCDRYLDTKSFTNAQEPHIKTIEEHIDNADIECEFNNYGVVNFEGDVGDEHVEGKLITDATISDRARDLDSGFHGGEVTKTDSAGVKTTVEFNTKKNGDGETVSTREALELLKIIEETPNSDIE